MKQLCQTATGILAEVEDPAKSSSAEEAQIRTRRVAFYQRNGLRETTIRIFTAGYAVPHKMVQNSARRMIIGPRCKKFFSKLYCAPLSRRQIAGLMTLAVSVILQKKLVIPQRQHWRGIALLGLVQTTARCKKFFSKLYCAPLSRRQIFAWASKMDWGNSV